MKRSAMIFRYCIISLRLALLLLASAVASAQKAPPAKPFERFDGCVLTPDEWTDGDSFRVRLPDGRLETFRLYFVDTTESRLRGKRSDEQAAYFGLTRADAIESHNNKSSSLDTVRPSRIRSGFRSPTSGCFRATFSGHMARAAERQILHGSRFCRRWRSDGPDISSVARNRAPNVPGLWRS
jgi:hypothetical protein